VTGVLVDVFELTGDGVPDAGVLVMLGEAGDGRGAEQQGWLGMRVQQG